jgi:hypothetical protein
VAPSGLRLANDGAKKKIAGTSVPAIRTFDSVTGSMRPGYDRLNEL